jgi:tetratricopeptide (TPR) repeat protein
VRKGFGSRFPLLTEAGIRKGIEYYEQALAIDPDYAQAHAELGYAYRELWDLHGRGEADLAMARARAEHALASDATNGSANELLANILLREYQWEEGRRFLDRGLAHNPGHSGLRAHSALLLAWQGRTAEALVEMRRAADLDPWFWAWHRTLGLLHGFAGEHGAAIEDLERAWKLAPGAPFIRGELANAYHLDARDEEALEAAVRELPPELASLEAAMRQGFAEAGFPGALRREVAWRVATRGEPCANDAWHGADALALLGEAEAMFECLGKAIGRKDMVFLKANRVYDPYRSDPRFTALLRRMNLAE